MERSNLFWFFSFDFLINCLLSFFTVLILVEIVLFVFRVKNLRGRIFAQLLPFAKLLSDPFLYDYSRWSLFHGQHPLFAGEGNRFLTIGFSNGLQMGLFLKNDVSFSLGDVLAFHLPFVVVKGIVIAVFTISSVLFALRVRLFVQEKKFKYKMTQFERNGLRVMVSEGVDVPCAILPRTVLFPKEGLEKLSDDEFAAIVAHEKEHLRFKDSWARLFLYFMTALFWWIPVWGAQKRLEDAQEKAADLGALRLGFSKFALASAVARFAKIQHAKQKQRLLVSAFCSNGAALRRVNQIANMKILKERNGVVKGVLVALFLSAILLGSFWIL
ncbi:MAG: hypothetical protein ChlgKO_10830 [Chlamydiales bacterium]